MMMIDTSGRGWLYNPADSSALEVPNFNMSGGGSGTGSSRGGGNGASGNPISVYSGILLVIRQGDHAFVYSSPLKHL